MTLRLFFSLLLTLCVGNVYSGETPNNIKLVESARKQIGTTVIYDPAYVRLVYPNGDVPVERGVCTDVVIRALRDSRKMDLQKLISEDMAARFSAYPKKWARTQPDKNIDHRRVPNLQTFFAKNSISLALTKNAEDYKAGDIVTSMLPGNLPHIMIVSDKHSSAGAPYVIHNIGNGTQEENSLFAYPLTGHYRLNH
jgi:uncharacterized protein